MSKVIKEFIGAVPYQYQPNDLPNVSSYNMATCTISYYIDRSHLITKEHLTVLTKLTHPTEFTFSIRIDHSFLKEYSSMVYFQEKGKNTRIALSSGQHYKVALNHKDSYFMHENKWSLIIEEKYEYRIHFNNPALLSQLLKEAK